MTMTPTTEKNSFRSKQISLFFNNIVYVRIGIISYRNVRNCNIMSLFLKVGKVIRFEMTMTPTTEKK